MGDVTLNKESYKKVIADDIKLVKQYIPNTFMLKTHILAVLHWSIDKQYPPEIWDKQTCDVCYGDGKLYDIDKDDDEQGYATTCPKCLGNKFLPLPPPPPARLIKEGKEPEKPPSKEAEDGKRSDKLPRGFMFNSAGRVVLDPKIIPNIDD
jgi:hypothetical protein